MKNEFVKIGAAGERLDASATEWGDVLDETTGLIWDKETFVVESHQEAVEKAAALGAGRRLPTRTELLTLVDDTRFNPAIDTAFFPGGPTNDWFWTSTPAASSPAYCAWSVDFNNGGSSWYNHDYNGFVRAVRPSQ